MRGEGRPRLTRLGIACCVAAVLAVVAGRATSITEYSILGVGLALLVLSSTLLLGWNGLDLEVDRTVQPQRLTAGEECVVTLSVRNRNIGIRLPVEITDRIDGATVSHGLTLPRPHVPAAHDRYPVRASRRGIARFGPLDVSMTDPFGLAMIRRDLGLQTEMIVRPKVHALSKAGRGTSDDDSGSSGRRRLIATITDDFDSLREYVPGDDVRLVHWASTARTGTPMVRTHQQPWQRRTTVVLDARRTPGGADWFERAVSAAASVADCCRSAGDTVRIVASSGLDTGYFDDPHRLEGVLDQLAAVQTSSGTTLHHVLAAAGTTLRSHDRLVVCAGPLAPEDHHALAVAGAAREMLVLACGDVPSALSPLGLGPGTARSVASFGPDDSLLGAWTALTRSRP